LVRRHGAAAAFDAILTGFLICGHLWDDKLQEWIAVQRRWERRSEQLIPLRSEMRTFSASRLFAAVYPEAVDIGELIAAPVWRTRASGVSAEQHAAGVGLLLCGGSTIRASRLIQSAVVIAPGDGGCGPYYRGWVPGANPSSDEPRLP